jgi:hypothetical protein
VVGGRPTVGTGPRSPSSGIAEAGEVDRRIQISIDRRASISVLIHAIAQAELGFRPTPRTQLCRGEASWRDHQRGATPGALVVELRTNPPHRGIPEARLRPCLRRPPRRAMFLADNCSTATPSWPVACAVVAL